MSKYAIMRFQKYKAGSVANIERHQRHRSRLRNRVHPERERACRGVRERGADEKLPWAHIDVGVDAEYFKSERRAAYSEKITPDCRCACTGCGADKLAPEVGCDA